MSKTHGDAVSRFLKIPSETNDLIQTIRSTLKLQQDQNRKSLIKIMSSITYLARQGIALRGHDEEDLNFIQLLKKNLKTLWPLVMDGVQMSQG